MALIPSASRSVLRVAGGGARALATAAVAPVTVPLGVLVRLERNLRRLEDIAVGVTAMHGEFVGMRADILTLDDHVVQLRDGVRDLASELTPLAPSLHAIETQMAAVDGHLVQMAGNLDALGGLTERLGRLARRRPRDGRVLEPPAA